MFVTGAALPSRFDPLTWHIHEMLFGFVMAAIAGFLLTAIPNWTGRLPVSGGAVALLAGLVAARPHRLPGFGARPGLARHRRGSVLSGAPGRGRRPGNRRRPELAQPADGRAGGRSRHRQSADASGGRWRRRAVRARMAARARRRHRADLGGGGPDRAELYPQLAGQAPGRRSPRRPWLDRPGGARHPACRPVRLGVLSGFRPIGLLLLLGAALNFGACCAGAAAHGRGAAAPRSPYRLCLAGARCRPCSVSPCSMPICRKARPSTP